MPSLLMLFFPPLGALTASYIVYHYNLLFLSYARRLYVIPGIIESKLSVVTWIDRNTFHLRYKRNIHRVLQKNHQSPPRTCSPPTLFPPAANSHTISPLPDACFSPTPSSPDNNSPPISLPLDENSRPASPSTDNSSPPTSLPLDDSSPLISPSTDARTPLTGSLCTTSYPPLPTHESTRQEPTSLPHAGTPLLLVPHANIPLSYSPRCTTSTPISHASTSPAPPPHSSTISNLSTINRSFELADVGRQLSELTTIHDMNNYFNAALETIHSSGRLHYATCVSIQIPHQYRPSPKETALAGKDGRFKTPNLHRFCWSGPLSGSTTPWHTSFQWSVLQELTLLRCLLSINDFLTILRSSHRLKECSIDKLADVSSIMPASSSVRRPVICNRLQKLSVATLVDPQILWKTLEAERLTVIRLSVPPKMRSKTFAGWLPTNYQSLRRILVTTELLRNSLNRLQAIYRRRVEVEGMPKVDIIYKCYLKNPPPAPRHSLVRSTLDVSEVYYKKEPVVNVQDQCLLDHCERWKDQWIDQCAR
ncbi:hypothetical protein BDQ17DRAFT_101501 [Cyathus striatus]|nr:hypothetical protein BDQ17DRAFT_101501 [Cyathus striatus]